jgi:outer membrane protein, heavy metal efflux system
LEELQLKALQNQPDYRAAQQGITAANSRYELQKVNGKPDVTVQGNYSHVNGINAANFHSSIPLPIFNGNQGEIARTASLLPRRRYCRRPHSDQVMTDIADAYEGLRASDHVVSFYRSGYLDISQQDRDIAEYAYKRGAASLFDFLDAERSYRATQLAYRRALAAYLTALGQVREAVGVRNLP